MRRHVSSARSWLFASVGLAFSGSLPVSTQEPVRIHVDDPRPVAAAALEMLCEVGEHGLCAINVHLVRH